MDEWDLLEAKDGAAEAYEEIVQRHYQSAFQFARQILSDAQHAEDVVQKAFVNIYVTRERCQRRAKFKTFLFRVVSNLAINELNRKRPVASVSEVMPDNREGGAFSFSDPDSIRPEAALESAELGQMIEAALQQLPPRHRAALYLREYQQMPYAGISEVLDASLNEVKIWIHRGRGALQKILKPYLDRGESIS
ncbi:MAG: RNA polymerase sigma-70 factor (ECF subfamily) [Planctomycetota bacterium]|jgi:RNA polymerase sigma-70 factor (ECF subfamily)